MVQYYQSLNKKDFTTKVEDVARKRKGKREYLNDKLTRNLMRALSEYFDSMVEIPRINVGKRQSVETLINKESLFFVKFLRDEKITWVPRILNLN